MEINIGVMCSCMPTLRPFFARVIPRLSISSFKLKWSRYYQQHSDPLEDRQALHLEQFRNLDINNSASTQRSPTTEPVNDGGVRNIVAF